MGNKPKNQNTDWTDEMNQYILKNYFSKGIRTVAKDLGRTKDAIRSHISTLRNEGYFKGMFDHVSKDDLISYVYAAQELHYDLLNDLNAREKQIRTMIDEKLELHHVMYKDLLNQINNQSND